MLSGWRVGRIGGVDILVDPSLAVIATLITASLWSQFSQRFAWLTGSEAFLLAILAALLFFLSILAHELAHAGMSRARRIPVSRITLFMFGGATHARIDSRGPGDEFLVTVVGPATSAAVAGIFLGLAFVARDAVGRPLAAVLAYLWSINLILALFNLLPGFPLDGGRLLRSAVWWATGSLDRATRVASRVGQGIGLLLLGGALAGVIVTGDLFLLWPAIIGWFLFGAARASVAETNRRRVLNEVRAGQVMSLPPPALSADMPIDTARERHLDGHEGEAFPVVEDGHVIGLVSSRTVREAGDVARVREAMVRVEGVIEAQADEPMEAVSARMSGRGVLATLVFEEGRLVGVIEPEDIQRLLRRGAGLPDQAAGTKEG